MRFPDFIEFPFHLVKNSIVLSAFMGRVTGPYPSTDWSAAKTNCEARGQRLMTIDSQEEENYVMNTLNPSSEYALFFL